MKPAPTCPTENEWQDFLADRVERPRSEEVSRHLESCRDCQTVVENLTKGDVSWQMIAEGLRCPPPELPPSCRGLLNRIANTGTDQTSHTTPIPSWGKGTTMPACLHLERMMHRNSIAVAGETAACYALLKLIPSTSGDVPKPLALNLALVLDVSGSMYEEDGTGVSRLKRVQEAALSAIQKLRPHDTLAIIGFAHNARVLLPSTSLVEKNRIEEVLRHIDRFDIDPGGTAMDEGLALALSEVGQHTESGKVSQIVVLTDGETSGEENCRMLAQQAAEKKILMTLMGVGVDWKAVLIKDLARLSNGKWLYIDVQASEEVHRIFNEEFASLAASAFMNVEMHLRSMKDVRIKRLRQVVPEIKELPLEWSEERQQVARLGTLQHDKTSRYILELALPSRGDGKYVVAQLELTYDLGNGQRESTGVIPLEMSYTASGNGYINAEVMKHIDDLQLKEMSDHLQQVLKKNDPQAAQELAQEIVEQGKLMGKRADKKTKLAINVLDELNQGSHVTRKTQLALDDAARSVEG